MNESRKIPQAGEIWRHFKGQEYKIMGVSDSQEIPDHPVDYWAIHTETEETLGVYHHDGKITVTKTDEPVRKEGLPPRSSGGGLTALTPAFVIYYKHHDARVWARPLDNFLEVIGDKPTNFYRFEKVA